MDDVARHVDPNDIQQDDEDDDSITEKLIRIDNLALMNAHSGVNDEVEDDDDDEPQLKRQASQTRKKKPPHPTPSNYKRLSFSPNDEEAAMNCADAFRKFQATQQQEEQQEPTWGVTTQQQEEQQQATWGVTTRLKSLPGTTTARQAKRKVEPKMKAGVRVYTLKRDIIGILQSDEQRKSLEGFNDDYVLYGENTGGGGKQGGYFVLFDHFPTEHKKLQVKRSRLRVLPPGAEEKQTTTFTNLSEAGELELQQFIKESINSGNKNKKKSDVYKESIKSFVEQETHLLRDTKVFQMKYKDVTKDEDIDCINWTILGDTEYITPDEDPLTYPDELDVLKEVDFENKSLSDIFFEYFFPSVVGHAKLMDEFLSDARASYYPTAKSSYIKFHDDRDDDPDWIIKNCYLLMIAAVTEPEIGIENLWQEGESTGRHNHAGFGKYVPMHYFKAFCSCATLMFGRKEDWYKENRDRGWEVMRPILHDFNGKRRSLFKVSLLLLDESMSGWRPKTSKLGGLPNMTYEPRKPVPLGTQLKNGVECLSGVLAFQDIVMAPEIQRQKGYLVEDDQVTPEKSHLPTEDDIQAHVAEVLRQVEGAGLKRGGWVGGDAWFGSVMSCVELMKRFGVHSTFIIKNNTFLFPIAPLLAVLQARHGEHPAGHWVVMKTVISDVQLLAIAYAWSQKGISYFISTCGCTQPSETKYTTKFENEWGHIDFKLIDRPNIVHFLYEYLPLIDEHNKQRQSLICLEKRWLTKDPWFRLLTTLVGMSVVDMHRFFRYEQIKKTGEKQEEVDNIRIYKFSDEICKTLRPWKRIRKENIPLDALTYLTRIQDEDGNTNFDPTEKQIKKGIRVGSPIQLSCFICRRYLDENGDSFRRSTSFWCIKCRMPLCRMPRKGADGGREYNCLEEHLYSEEQELQCDEDKLHKRGQSVPEHLHVCLFVVPRRSKRKKT